jgi:Sec-independent protein translocase protein TatA
MFGVGPQELVIIGLLLLVIFGANGFSTMARDLGRLVKGAHSTVEDVKSEFVPEEIDEARRAVEDLKSELVYAREWD